MSVSVSSWAGSAQLLSAAAISCCSIHESPARAARRPCREVGAGWHVPAVPGFMSCPLGAEHAGIRGEGWPLPCHCLFEPGTEAVLAATGHLLGKIPFSYGQRGGRAEPSRNTGWDGGQVLNVPRCPLGFPICPSILVRAVLGPHCPRTVYRSPGASLLPSPRGRGRSWDAGG